MLGRARWAGLLLVFLTAGCVYQAGGFTDGEAEPELELTWEKAPNVTEVGVEERIAVSIERRNVQDGGLIASSFVVSEDPRERPSPDGARLDCFPPTDLWNEDSAQTACSFEEPGTWYVRGFWHQKGSSPLDDVDTVRAWSHAREVTVLPRLQVGPTGDTPGSYDPSEPVNITVVVNASQSLEGEVEIAYGPPDQGDASDPATFAEHCPREPFEGDTAVDVTCDWSDGGEKDWVVFVHVDAGDEVYTRPEGAPSGFATVHGAWAR